MAKGETTETKLALRHFYDGAEDRVEVSKRVLLQGSDLPDVAKLIGVPQLMALVSLMLYRFNGQFNFAPSKKMTSGQIEDLAADLVLEFTNRKGNQVRFEELAIFFDRAGKGEFEKRNGVPFVFDRIDRQVVMEILDFYFETDRTQAVWALEDEKEKAKRNQLGLEGSAMVAPRTTAPIVLDKNQNDVTPKTIWSLKEHGAGKVWAELERKYGSGSNE